MKHQLLHWEQIKRNNYNLYKSLINNTEDDSTVEKEFSEEKEIVTLCLLTLEFDFE